MGAFFTAILAKIVSLAKWFGLLAVAVFLGAWDLLRDLVCWVFEQCLTAADAAIAGANLDGVACWGCGGGGLPAEIVNMCGLLGVGDAVAVIVGAILIRLVLQLIPFTRLGS